MRPFVVALRPAAAVLLATAAVAASPLPAADAARTVGCRSGLTRHADRTVRVFSVTRDDSTSLYVCPRRGGRPRRIWGDGGPSAYGTFLSVHGRVGQRLAISWHSESEGGGDAAIGWIDLRSGRSVEGQIDPADQEDVTRVAIGADGSIAFLLAADSPEDGEYEDGEPRTADEIAYATIVPRTRRRPAWLRSPGIAADGLPAGAVTDLQLGRAVVRWRLRGQASWSSAPR